MVIPKLYTGGYLGKCSGNFMATERETWSLIAMAACMATTLSLTCCASLALRRPEASPSSGEKLQQHSVSFAIAMTPQLIGRGRRRGSVLASFNPASSLAEGEVQSAARAAELSDEDDQVHYAQVSIC